MKSGSEAIGRIAGGKKASPETIIKREEICHQCELLRKDEIGEWCGELLRLRFGKETKKRKGCGCLLDEKRLYENFSCPKNLWPKC